MLPQMKMSGFDRVRVGARISKSGQPIGQPGDFYSESDVIDWKSYQGIVEITIDQIKP